ncbi:MAG: LppX_LprAFG lipoprotein [Actinomycetia bacterium]|nr:LppX_LprAFG lipoprotein [Actinomycetes bacterium]
MTRLRPALLIAGCTLTLVAAGCGGSDDISTDSLPPDPVVVLDTAAETMGQVETVRFSVEASGAPIHVDPAGTLALESVEGRFVSGTGIDALLTVDVAGAFTTQLGAVAIGDEIFLTNPLTGKFELLPADFGFDPGSFFDPVGGWQPLLETLRDPVFVGEEDRNGTRYHVSGTAPAASIESITAGLAPDQEVEVELWIDPLTAHVTALEMTTESDGELTSWVVEMQEYDAPIEIERPDTDE